jgi:hypothetical protein
MLTIRLGLGGCGLRQCAIGDLRWCYHVIHNGDYNCPTNCENENINRIIHADTTSDLQWRIGVLALWGC